MRRPTVFLVAPEEENGSRDNLPIGRPHCPVPYEAIIEITKECPAEVCHFRHTSIRRVDDLMIVVPILVFGRREAATPESP
jgi:hypothetical protein